MGLFDKVFNGIFGNGSESRSQEDIDFEKQVRNVGYEYAGKRIADLLNEKITSKDLAKQFVLEELDAARQGNDYAKNFVKNSGFKSVEYVGAMNKTRWVGDESELEHLQLFLRAFLIKISDIDLMVKVSTAVVDEIMKIWKLGKYENSNKDNFSLNHDLNNILKQLDFSDEKVDEIIQDYSDVTQNIITGSGSIGSMERMNQFAELMAMAALITPPKN